jgi:hypothetical protein
MKKITVTILACLFTLSIVPFAACIEDESKINTYKIEALYDETAKTLSSTVTFNYYNDTENSISELKFNLWGNAYREGAIYSPVSDAYTEKAYYKGESFGGMNVEKVENCASWGVAGEDENILIVNLLTPIYPQNNEEIVISYTLTLADVNHRTGVTENTINLGNFYPVLCAYTSSGFAENPYISCGDPFVSDVANYEVTLNYPAHMLAATSGKMLAEKTVGEKKTCTYALTNARDFAIVLSDNFKTLTQDVGDTQITYYYYTDNNPQTTLTVAAESVEYFCEQFGQYTYPTLSVVQTGFCLGGMEYPALTMISDNLDEASALYTVVHENAHQWWYALVGSNQVNYSWQDEGLAEYSSLLFFENNPNYGITRTSMLGLATKAYRAFYSVYNQIFGNADTTMNRNLSAFVSDYEYVNIAYNKALLMFEAVRVSMGDEKFFACLKDYFTENIYTLATPEHLIAAFARRADVEGVFSSFLEGKIII